ncbi:MAG: helix-turn-helix domain-containing protein, partial [Coriobacteriales bacterium]|nr:helix-turn-helix domain-containing protein [Coriobacteriales bacterium]
MHYSYDYINLHGSQGAAADVMRQLAAATNLNASGLAEAMGVAPSTVTRILHGQVCPSYDAMQSYAHSLAFQIEDNYVVRPEHLRGYLSPKEIGDFLNRELSLGLDSERLRFILRSIPKMVIDWQYLESQERDALMLQPARV